MQRVTFRSDITVELISSNVSDELVTQAARVSTKGAESRGDEANRGLIKYLMSNNHWSPFEHGSMTFLVECPIFVSREWLRHKSWSFNEESGRYKELDGEFYVPDNTRPLCQEGKPGAYTIVQGSHLQFKAVETNLRAVCETAYESYLYQLSKGVAREVARMVLPVTTYTSFYATANPRSILHFCNLRQDETAQWEIRQGANQVMEYLQKHMMMTVYVWEEIRDA